MLGSQKTSKTQYYAGLRGFPIDIHRLTETFCIRQQRLPEIMLEPGEKNPYGDYCWTLTYMPMRESVALP